MDLFGISHEKGEFVGQIRDIKKGHSKYKKLWAVSTLITSIITISIAYMLGAIFRAIQLDIPENLSVFICIPLVVLLTIGVLYFLVFFKATGFVKKLDKLFESNNKKKKVIMGFLIVLLYWKVLLVVVGIFGTGFLLAQIMFVLVYSFLLQRNAFKVNAVITYQLNEKGRKNKKTGQKYFNNYKQVNTKNFRGTFSRRRQYNYRA